VKRVVVIGAGNRGQGAVLPALRCLRDRFEVAAVVTRTAREIVVGGESIATRDSLDGIDFAAVDLVIVAASLPQIPRLLERLARGPSEHLVVMLDTPVVRTGDLRRAMRWFGAFRRVVVSEDTIALPPFVLARRLIDDGAIGALRRVYLFHSGYKYHAMASIKMLAGGAAVRRIVARKYAGKIKRKDIALDNGVHAVLYEPRDYAIGKFLLDGDAGRIADYDLVGGCRRIGYRLDGSIYRGLALDGEPVPPAGLDGAYLAGVGSDVHDASPMNTMKLRGLMDLIVAALDDDSPRLHYAPAQAIADDIGYRIADRVGVFVAPRLIERAVGLLQRGGR
jgi:hypothetical protein